MKSNLFFTALCVLLVTFQITFSQTKDTSINNSLLKYKFALQYETGYNFSTRSIDPVTFLLKYHLSDRSALRLGFGVNGNMEGGRGPNHHNRDTIQQFEHFGKVNEQYTLTLSYLFYPAPKSDINLFFGAGPCYSFGSSHFEKPFPIGPDTTMNKEDDRNEPWSLGLTGIFGAEWFAARSISFFTEYNASFVYQNNTEWKMQQNLPPVPEETSEFRFTDISARIGLSLYFNYPF